MCTGDGSCGRCIHVFRQQVQGLLHWTTRCSMKYTQMSAGGWITPSHMSTSCQNPLLTTGGSYEMLKRCDKLPPQLLHRDVAVSTACGSRNMQNLRFSESSQTAALPDKRCSTQSLCNALSRLYHLRFIWVAAKTPRILLTGLVDDICADLALY